MTDGTQAETGADPGAIRARWAAPPASLGAIGAALWRRVTASCAFDDPGSVETLFQACASADLAEARRETIGRDGVLIRAKAGVRDHPLIKHEIAARAFTVRSLSRLGLDLEPVRSGPGRPGGY